jgi:hypothetical protein
MPVKAMCTPFSDQGLKHAAHRRAIQGLDQLGRALVPLSGARRCSDGTISFSGRCNRGDAPRRFARARRVTFDEHRQELPHLVDVVARPATGHDPATISLGAMGG